MKAVRRVAFFAAVPLALVVLAGYGWYRWSDTGKRWRYEDKLATYCDGLIPYAESAKFTGLDTEVGLSRDMRHEAGDDSFDSCEVADMRVTIGLVDDDRVNDTGYSMLDMLQTGSSDYLPVALGGGWRGYTDLNNTGVVLPCENKVASLVVSIAADVSHENPAEARAMAELAAATARKAAAKLSCEGEFGGRIPKVSTPKERTFPESIAGTCRGVPLHGAVEVDWVQETQGSGTAPLESCVLGETKAGDADLYALDASFGPYAQRLRSSSDRDGPKGNAGVGQNGAWATASCPGSTARALFSIVATEYASPTKSILVSSLRPFAERSAKRHGCTDLKLPA